MQIPAPDLRPDRFRRLIRDRRAEVDEVPPLATLRSPRAKRIPQKIEFLVWICTPPVIILAIDDLCLLRMKLQPTLPHPRGYGCPYLLGFSFRSAVHDGIISEALKRQLRIRLRHPPIKGIMQDR